MDKNNTVDLTTVLNSLHNRREFLQLFGKGLGYTALVSTLPACGGGGGDPAPSAVIPQAAGEYTASKRTSFGVHCDALGAIQSLGIDAYLDQQLDYLNLNDGDLETTIQTLFPLTTQSPAQLIAGFPDNIAGVPLLCPALNRVLPRPFGNCSCVV